MLRVVGFGHWLPMPAMKPMSCAMSFLLRFVVVVAVSPVVGQQARSDHE
jgi:hypothetical protein